MTFTVPALHANIKGDRYDYGNSWPKRRRTKFVELVQAINHTTLRPWFITLVECQEATAKPLAKLLGMSSVSYLGSTILYDAGLLAMSRVLLRESWLKGHTHSLLAVEFRVRATGKTFNVAASHLPPFVTRTKLRRAQMAKTTKLTADWHDRTVLAIDANWPKTLEAAFPTWLSARFAATRRYHANYKTSGTSFKPGHPIDYVLGRHGVRFSYYDVVDGRKASDHNPIKYSVEL